MMTGAMGLADVYARQAADTHDRDERARSADLARLYADLAVAEATVEALRTGAAR